MPANPLRPLPPAEFDYWHAQHLLVRAGFGGPPEAIRLLASRGLDGAVQDVITGEAWDGPGTGSETTFSGEIMRPWTMEERANLAQAQERGDEAAVERFRRQRQMRQRDDRAQLKAMRRWWLTRMLETPHPLQEKMTLFWHGHFATGYRTIEDSWHMYLQNRLFRQEATGNFARLCSKVIRDPAMLKYLDNDQNRRGAPNENLARELMELFVLGEGNGYTEEDIREGARALTGYTFQDDRFRFNESVHDTGSKRILGRRGPFNGEDFLGIILQQRAASEFICLKLVRFFVNDRPGTPDAQTREVVKGLARTLRRHDYELQPVLEQLFTSRFFYAPSNRSSVVKSPIQLIVQAIRTFDAPPRDPDTLLEAAGLMGQDLLQPPSVKGWDGGRSWINTSTLFVRQNLLVYLLTGRRPEGFNWRENRETFNAMPLLEHLQAQGRLDPDEVTDYILHFSLGHPPHPDRRALVRSYFTGVGDRVDNDRMLGCLALITAMPEYQLC